MTDAQKITEVVAEEIHDVSYLGKQVPPGTARVIAERLSRRGLLADAVKEQTEPPVEDVREVLAEALGAFGHAVRHMDTLEARAENKRRLLARADSILARFAVSPKKGQD